MGTMTLSVPDALKARMDMTDWVNWSSVARRAFSETLKDVNELELKRKIRGISEISEDDVREVKPSIVKAVAKSLDSISKELKSGKRKPMTRDEFNKWCDSL